MRTRQRSIVTKQHPAHPSFSHQAKITNCSGVATVFSPTTYGSEPVFNTEGVDEKISDSLGRGIQHGVIHRKMSYSITDKAMSLGKSSPTGPTGVTTYTPSDVLLYEGRYYARYADSFISNWPLLVSNTAVPPGWTISTPVYNEQSIINDLYERASQLKADMLLNVIEANEIWPSLKSLITTLPELKRSWGSLRKVLKTASNSYLAWKFGVSPILSDLSSIARFGPNMSRDYARVISQATVRFSKVIPLNCVFNLADTVDKVGSITWRKLSFQGYFNRPCNVRYQLVVKPTERYKTDFFKKLDFLLQRFSTSPASLAWEKIPFSFVADWFVDLRGPLREMDRFLWQPPFEIVSLTRSLTYDLSSDSFYDWYSPCNGAPLWTGRTSHREYRHYERTPLSPRVLYPQWRGRFGKSQAGISAALISQKLSSLGARRS